MTDAIQRRLDEMTANEAELRAAAIEEGYKDEVCADCGVVFLAHHHFVSCPRLDCPMKDGKPSLLDQLSEM